MIILLAVLGKESSRGRHCENGNERVLLGKYATMNQNCELNVHSKMGD
jgi:hypothetical protein